MVSGSTGGTRKPGAVQEVRRATRERQGDDGHRRVVDLVEALGGAGRDRAQQPGGRGRGQGEDDAVDVERLAVDGRSDGQPPPVRAAGELDGPCCGSGSARRGPTTAAARSAASSAETAAVAREDRPTGGVGRGTTHDRRAVGAAAHSAGTVACSDERPGVTRVDAGQERFDEAVDDRRPHPVGDEVADGDVLLERRTDLLGRRPGDLVRREDAGRGGGIGGYAHHRSGRQGPATAAAPHRRGDGFGMGQPTAETEVGDQAGRLRPAGQHRLRADVDRVPRHLGAAELPADRHRRTRGRPLERRCPATAPTPPTDRRCRRRRRRRSGGHGSTVAAEPLWNGLGSLECPEG